MTPARQQLSRTGLLRSRCAAWLLCATVALTSAGAAVPPLGPASAGSAPPGQPATNGGAPKAAPSKAWAALSPAQQQSLAPLAGSWNALSLAHQRKWLALSENFSKLNVAEQQILHSRMREWAALSTRQRAQARLNFGEAKQVSAADKKALWEAYQALPPDEKKKLAADAKPKPPTTAAAVKPVAKQKLATLPTPAPDARAPRIAAGPGAEAGATDLPALRTPAGPQQAH